MRDRLVPLLCGLLAMTGLALLVAPGTLGALRAVIGAPAAPSIQGANAIAPDEAVPTLDAGEQKLATSLLAADDSVGRVLGGIGFQVSQLGPWTGRRGRLVGAAAVLTLDRPLTGERAWPLIRYDHTEQTTPPYRSRVEHLDVRNATQIDVLIDFHTRRVVSLQPDGPSLSVARGSDVVSLPRNGD